MVVDGAQRAGQAAQRFRLAGVFRLELLALYEARQGNTLFRQVGDDLRADAGSRRSPRAGDCALAVDAEFFGALPRDAQHVGLAPGLHLVVAVGHAAAQERDPDPLAAQRRHARH